MAKTASKAPPNFEDTKARAIAEARADVAAGRLIDHEAMATWLQRIEAGESPPPPKPSSRR